MKLSNGVEVVDVPAKELEEHRKLFRGTQSGLVRIGKDGTILPSHYKKWAQQYADFKFRPSDVLVLTYPKCGTTWTQEVVWTMCHNPNLDNPDCSVDLEFRAPFMEFDTLVADLTATTGMHPGAVAALKKMNPSANPEEGLFLKLAENSPDRRVIKCHLPFSVLPQNLLDNCKVVYVVRNPKDLAVSYLHHHRLIKVHDYVGDDETFIDHFCKGDLYYGGYDKHLAGAWQRKGHKNLHIAHFEDMKMNNIEELKKLDSFLGTGLSDTQLQNVSTHTSFSSMKSRETPLISDNDPDKKAVDGQGVPGLFNTGPGEKKSFFRKGQAGSWKSDLNASSVAKLDAFIKEKVNPTGFKFTYG